MLSIWFLIISLGGLTCVNGQECRCEVIEARARVIFQCNNKMGFITSCWHSPANSVSCDSRSCFKCNGCTSYSDLWNINTNVVNNTLQNVCSQQTGCAYDMTFSKRISTTQLNDCIYITFHVNYSCSDLVTYRGRKTPKTPPTTSTTTRITRFTASPSFTLAMSSQYNTVSNTSAVSAYYKATLPTQNTTSTMDTNTTKTRLPITAVIAGVLCAAVVVGAGLTCAVLVVRRCNRPVRTTSGIAVSMHQTSAAAENVYSGFNTPNTNQSNHQYEVINHSPQTAVYAVINRRSVGASQPDDYIYGNVDFTASATAVQTPPSGGSVTLVENSLYELANSEGYYGGVTIVDNMLYE